MLSKIQSIALNGLDGCRVSVQVDISNGLPAFDIVGLPDTSIREAKERVKSAIKNSISDVVNRKIVVNLAPANVRKAGSSFDLPIAVGILQASEIIKNRVSESICFIGELSLDGKINKINGALAMAIEAQKLGFKEIIVPSENLKETSLAREIVVKGANNLEEIVKYLSQEILTKNPENNETKEDLAFDLQEIHEDLDSILENHQEFDIDFTDVKGQEVAKRALEIAASGGHNILLIGEPGSGKTMLAKRIVTILPKLSYEESLELTKVYSIAGKLDPAFPIITKRPFRMPHHSIPKASLIGGGNYPNLGEITLANDGVLFLDEFAEVPKSIIELLRGPIEDEKITITRGRNSVTYPSKFILITAMNPCPCGYYGSKLKECTCTKQMIDKYISKISGPILDRIDLHVPVDGIEYKKINSDNSISSTEMRQKVENARKIQEDRYKNEKINQNASLTNTLIKKYCKLGDDSNALLEIAFNKLKLSMRSYTRIIKVARTIADLDNSKDIQKKHIAEAINYRVLDRYKK